jgi:uncharacterized protein YkwD
VATAATLATAAPLDDAALAGSTAWRVDPPRLGVVDPDERAGRQLLGLVNDVRRSEGLPELAWDARVGAAAQAHSDYMASIPLLTHSGPGGSSAGDRLAAEGFDWWTWGETVGAGQQDPHDLVEGWLASPAHREHLLGEFTVAGGGVAATPSGIPYWTLVFAVRA